METCCSTYPVKSTISENWNSLEYIASLGFVGRERAVKFKVGLHFSTYSVLQTLSIAHRYIKFCVKLHKNATFSYVILKLTFADKTVSTAQVFEWF
jgi:hypothetical protein